MLLQATRDETHALYDDAELYDCITWGVCEPFYFEAASRCGGPVLELACGTGRMLVPMAMAGLEVTGIDISHAMLDGARARAAHLNIPVQLVAGDMRRFQLPNPFALVFVAVNSLLHLSSTQDLRSCFRSVRDTLRPDGLFTFDIHNFSASHLARAPDQRHEVGRYMSPAHGPLLIEERCRYDEAAQLLHRTWLFSTPRRPDFREVQFAMRVVFPEELTLLLELEGFRLEERYGDLDCSPFRADSPSQVCVARPI